MMKREINVPQQMLRQIILLVNGTRWSDRSNAGMTLTQILTILINFAMQNYDIIHAQF